MSRAVAATAATILMLTASLAPAQDDAPLGLGDLAAEREALAADVDAETSTVATFRDLWERPDEFRGRRVRVEGRIVRTFRQDAVGSFPALTEAWIEQPPGDLLCIVFPAPAHQDDAWKGATVSFAGVYLRRIRYKAEGDRLAPLIVGPKAPVVAVPAPPASPNPDAIGTPGTFAVLGLLTAASAVSALLAWRTLTTTGRRGRSTPTRAETSPPPEFLGPEDDHGDRP